jgi:nitroimidazol reductase NimA-like FMN-containing flavoprotein (pyridoxamine 5'-phosphate oxidase superfamily)
MPKYHMHKKEREIIDRQEIFQILRRGKYTTISLCRNNEPYVVTMNYGFDEEKNALYFHCAQKGLKLDFIKENPNACATVIEDRGYLMNECAHAYWSVVLWGKMTRIENIEEKKAGIEVLLHHLEDDPDIVRKRTLQKENAYQNVMILRLDIEEITGKQGQ